jgi:predicted  nucleic acid-binding Zn-ribbon protein
MLNKLDHYEKYSKEVEHYKKISQVMKNAFEAEIVRLRESVTELKNGYQSLQKEIEKAIEKLGKMGRELDGAEMQKPLRSITENIKLSQNKIARAKPMPAPTLIVPSS